MVVKKMGLSWIVVKDLAQTKKFFVDTVGLKVCNDAVEHGWLELQGEEGGMLLGVGQECQEKEYEAEKAGMNAVVTMSVDDIVAAKAELEKKGVKFLGDIIEVPGHVKMATFIDLDGNKFQIVQELD